MDFKDKADSLASRMNKLTESFDLAEDMTVAGDDIIEYVEKNTQDIDLYSEDFTPAEIVNLQTMVEDFKYIRETLKETTDNGRRVLNSVTLDLLDSDEDKRAQLILSFAELNKSVGDNMKLYMQSYKDISTVLLNLDKIMKSSQSNPSTVNNTINLNSTEATSTVDLLKEMRNLSNNN